MTSIQEGYKLTMVLLDNRGHASIGGLSEAVGADGFGTKFRMRNNQTGQLNGGNIPMDLAANAESLGAIILKPEGKEGLSNALEEAKGNDRTTVIFVEVDREQRVGGYESWWDVPIAEVSTDPAVQAIRARYEEEVKEERHYLG
jgi:3D-(3,5/4)-trihydroxycyclohexane-1,2-dione acylhydrolase (decyclizing)